MRKPFIAGNWKLHKTVAESVALARELVHRLADVKERDVAVAPAFTALASVAAVLSDSPVALAGQNCYPEAQGAFTGEVSPYLLKDVGCRHVIVGHSERRQLFGETDGFINTKVKAVVGAGLTAIFCIGETLAEREQERTFSVLEHQVRIGLNGLDATSMQHVIIAYEPVWAIGTGRTATTGQAQEAHGFIRGLLAEMFGDVLAQEIRILYGGSVKADNIDALMAQPDVDGALVGGASLKADEFVRIAAFQNL